MGLDEWSMLLGDLGFTRELTSRKVNVMFAQSRMMVVHEGSSGGNEKASQKSQLTQLSYESFLEALVRLAVAKALPSDSEMRRHGFQFPGELFGAKLDLGVSAFRRWIEQLQQKQRRGLGDPIWRRLDVLILLMINIMQFGVEKTEGGAALLLRGSPDETLSLEEVKRYCNQPTPNVFETGPTGTAAE